MLPTYGGRQVGAGSVDPGRNTTVTPGLRRGQNSNPGRRCAHTGPMGTAYAHGCGGAGDGAGGGADADRGERHGETGVTQDSKRCPMSAPEHNDLTKIYPMR